MKINKLHALFLQSKGVSSDTRRIEEGTIFFALKGENFNGNQFAHEAIEAGAAFVVVDEPVGEDDKIIQVPDVLETLQRLATFHRRYLKIPVIALTGSNGKTTTKELLNAVLSKKFKICATRGNLNNHIGVPMTLLSMTRETQIGVVEMGANHPGEIAVLCEIAQPDYGYITNFGKAHLEGFGGIEGVVKAKSELYDFLKREDKTIFVNSEDERQIIQSKGGNTYFIGEAQFSDCRLHFIQANPFVEMSFAEMSIRSQLIGKYNAKNIAAAVGIGNYFGVSAIGIKEAIESFLPGSNRSQIMERNGNKVIMDAYNANPTSMAAALESFDALHAEKKLLILGDMFEVGKNTLLEHETIVHFIESYDFDRCFLCGKNFYETKRKSDKIEWFRNFEELKNKLQGFTLTKCIILVKGSRGMALERVLEYI